MKTNLYLVIKEEFCNHPDALIQDDRCMSQEVNSCHI